MQLKSEEFVVNQDKYYTGSVFFDSTIGSSTVFSFYYTDSDAPDVDLYDPDGKMICSVVSHSPDCDPVFSAEVNPTYKSITFKIPGITKVSLVLYNFPTFQL